MTPPTVRVRTALTWTYRLISHDEKKELERGEQTINLFPQDLGLTRVLKQQRRAAGELVVVEQQDSLSKRLEHSNALLTRVGDANKLQLLRPRIVLVGPDALLASGFDQAPLLGLANYGASVMIFQQTRCGRLIGYGLAQRELPAKLEWRADHPLLRGLTAADLDSWFTDGAAPWAVQLPADEPALEIGYWPSEIPGLEASPIDALLLTKTVGKGRLVFCQLPLGPWDQDPRSQILLTSALDYLQTRPEPTPPPSQRPLVAPVAPTSIPIITIPAGDKP